MFYPCSGVTGGMDPTVKLVAMTDVRLIYFPSRSDSHVKRRKKRGKSDSRGQAFFSVTVYFSPVSLGLQKMKTTAAAQQAESAPDSRRESGGRRSNIWSHRQRRNYDTQISSHTCHTEADNRGLSARLMWMETLVGGATNENKLFMCAINPQLNLRAVTLKEAGCETSSETDVL